MNKMNNKNLYYYIGGAAALGLLYMYFKKSSNVPIPTRQGGASMTETR